MHLELKHKNTQWVPPSLSLPLEHYPSTLAGNTEEYLERKNISIRRIISSALWPTTRYHYNHKLMTVNKTKITKTLFSDFFNCVIHVELVNYKNLLLFFSVSMCPHFLRNVTCYLVVLERKVQSHLDSISQGPDSDKFWSLRC